MNRRRFLYSSMFTATCARYLSAFTQDQPPAQTEPKTLMEYQGSSAAVDSFMRGATANRTTIDAIGAFIAAAKAKPSGRDSTDADLVILADKTSDAKLNLKLKDSDAIAMKTDNAGILEVWKTTPPKAVISANGGSRTANYYSLRR